MTRILMVCLGNICRSPLAEGIMRKNIEAAGLDAMVDSSGTAHFHIGQSPDPRSTESGQKHGVDITPLRGRQFGVADYDNFDLIYVMDNSNYKNVLSLARDEVDKSKVELLLNVSNPDKFLDIPDPYYGGEQGFENVYQMINEACAKIADNLKNE